MTIGTMDLTPLLYICRVAKRSSLLLLDGLLLQIPMIPMISVVLAISMIGHVDFPIALLLLWGSLPMWFKELISSLGGLIANIGNRK
jgi:hypothetical protein